MSGINLKTTNGEITITPEDGVGSVNLNLPRAGFGKVLDVYQAVKKDVWSTSGWNWVDIDGLSITLTPKSANSRFLISYTVRASSDYWCTYVNLLRNGTQLAADATDPGGRVTPTSIEMFEDGIGDAHGFIQNHNVTFLDEPNTTSPITYNLQGTGRTTGSIMYVNRSVNDRITTDYDARMISYMQVMEIGA